MSGIQIDRFEEQSGKIVEEWAEFDLLGAMVRWEPSQSHSRRPGASHLPGRASILRPFLLILPLFTKCVKVWNSRK
jgi:hypothetical protein